MPIDVYARISTHFDILHNSIETMTNGTNKLQGSISIAVKAIGLDYKSLTHCQAAELCVQRTAYVAKLIDLATLLATVSDVLLDESNALDELIVYE